jgi:CMP/dCMP kinase
MIITIDGPTASGKTTIARMLAQQLDYYYLSSGLLFRGLAYVLVHDFFYNPEQLKNPREQDVQKALAGFIYRYDKQSGEQLMIHNKIITQELRSQAISQYASIIATNMMVRNALAKLQHSIANSHNIVAEGRDMGSAIFPNAHIKFFLTAALDVRAKRWQKDQKTKGKDVSFDEACNEVEIRDERDTTRAVAPLIIPEGAIILDDSNLNQEQVLEKMLQEIEKIKKIS